MAALHGASEVLGSGADPVSSVHDGGPEVRLRNGFERPYDDAIAAARTCYSPRVIEAGEVTPRQRRQIGPLTFQGGHHTVYQHATFEFSLSGVSRQLVWCFLHAFPFYNTEQQSQRYVRLDEPRAHVPPALRGEARELYVGAIERAWQAYRELTQRLVPVTRGILSGLWRLDRRKQTAFARDVAREAEKKAIETARYVIPIACHTAMVYTVSGLVLHRLRRMAAASDAPDEARDVVGRMVALVERVDPAFFSEVGDPRAPATRWSRAGRRRRASATPPRPPPSTPRSAGAARCSSTGAPARRRWWPRPCATCWAVPSCRTPRRWRWPSTRRATRTGSTP